MGNEEEAGTEVTARRGILSLHNFFFVSGKAAKPWSQFFSCLVFDLTWPSLQVHDGIVQLPSWCSVSLHHPIHWLSMWESHT